MGFIKCPRCDLNYIRDTEQFCPVCLREMKGGYQEEAVEICSICGENPVMPGKDVCQMCYKEMKQQQGLDDENSASEQEAAEASMEMDDVSDMREIEIDDPAEEEEDDVPDELKVSLEEEQDKEREETEKEDAEEEE